MQKNPYPPTIKDETGSGVVISNQRHEDWQTGYAAAVVDCTRIFLYSLPKIIGIKLPMVGDLLKKLP